MGDRTFRFAFPEIGCTSRRLLALVGLTLALTGSACGSSDSSGPTGPSGVSTTAASSVACAFSISPTSNSLDASGGAGSVTVSATPSGCTGGSWTATSNASFITITSAASGTTAATVTYSVSSNPTANARSGTLTIAGATFTVTQAVAPLSIVTGTSNLTVTHFTTFYRVTGVVDVTLNHEIAPAPSRVRAEWETSLVGGSTTTINGLTQLHFDINQDTIACPHFPASGDFLRLIDVDRLVTLTRTSWTHGGSLPTLCN